MIKLISSLPEIPSDNIRTAKIKCCFAAYGAYPKIALFHVQEADGKITALFSLFGGVLTVSPFENADFPEIKEFISMSACHAVYCSENTANALGLTAESKSTVLVFGGTSAAHPVENTYAGAKELSDRLSSVFDADKDELYADISHRIRHGCLEYVTSPYSVAAMQTSCDCGVITGICTDAEKRKSGIGSAVLSRLTESVRGKKIFAECESETVPFYLKNGFRITDMSVICKG